MPWGAERSRFTALFEALVIDCLPQASVTAVGRLIGLSWDEVHGVMQQAVGRGLEPRQVKMPGRLGVDDASFQKRHEDGT